MTGVRLDHLSIVVSDLEAAIAFFAELGLELEGRAPIEGDWVDRINAIDGLRVEIAMMRTPDGRGRVELTKFLTPPAIGEGGAPPNALGLRSIMFAVDDLDAAVERLRGHGGELVGEIERYEDVYRLCYLRGPDGIIVALAQELG
jgi:catechol 2,3-dioxygenase-like lactoylglutathione lyase family enzyme